MRPKMILFDYGGTLMYEPDFDPVKGSEALFPYIVSNPHDISPTGLNDYIQTLFAEIREQRGELIEIHEHIFLRFVLEYFDLKLSVSYKEAEKILFDNISMAEKTPYSEEMLSFLRENGIRTGVISNLCWSGDTLSERLYSAFKNHRFDFIMTSSEYIFRKPDRHIFDLAVRKSGLNADEIWYCGNDIPMDIAGSHNAGLFPVFYDDPSIINKTRTKNEKYSISFKHLKITGWKEFTDILKNNN